MKKNKNTLLITGAIDISNYAVPFVKITNLQERLQQYLDSLDYAINHYSKVDYIVFCENTNYSYDYSDLQKKAEKKGKKLEVLTFKGDYENIQKKGKGYGEGEIIKYALNHSAILAQSNCFYKLTGRVCVANFDKIIRTTPFENAFVFSPWFEREFKRYTRTSFYKASIPFYKQNLMDAYLEVDDNQGKYLEHVFYDKLSKTPIKSFKLFPNLIGITGSSRELYAFPKKEMFKNKLFARLGFLDNYQTMKQKIWLQIHQIYVKTKKALFFSQK